MRCLTPKTPFLLLASLILGTASAGAATTNPVGAVAVSIPAGSVAFTPVFINPDASVGSIDSLTEATSTTVVGLNGASWTVGQFDEGTFPQYYLEIIEAGSLEGYVFDIISSTANTVEVEGLLSTDFSVTTGIQAVVRKHYTLADIFGSTTGLQDFDSVTVYSDTGVPTAYFKVGSIWSSDFGVTDHSDFPIYPGSGFVTAFQGAVSVVLSGSVKYSATKVPLYANIINIATAINPVDAAVSSLGLEDSFADFELITTYAFDGAFSSPLAYFDVPGVGMSSDFTTETTDTVSGHEGFVVSVGQDQYWTAPAAYTPAP